MLNWSFKMGFFMWLDLNLFYFSKLFQKAYVYLHPFLPLLLPLLTCNTKTAIPWWSQEQIHEDNDTDNNGKNAQGVLFWFPVQKQEHNKTQFNPISTFFMCFLPNQRNPLWNHILIVSYCMELIIFSENTDGTTLSSCLVLSDHFNPGCHGI